MYRSPLILMWLVLPLCCLAADERPRGVADADRVNLAPTDWPWWRGPDRNGVAAASQKPPLKWSATRNVLWKCPVPGRGHGSPIVVGDQVFLATAEEENQTQSVLCHDRRTGKRLWQAVVHRGGFEKKGNVKASLASSTVACDGRRLFVNFLNGGAVYTTALSRDGTRLWQTKISDYVVHQGYGSSPAIYGPLVIVSADNKGGGAVAGLERATGKVVWKRERPRTPNYASPIILTVAGRDQLLLTGCDLVTSLDPLTGKQLWEIEGATTECVSSTVTDGKRIITSGGFPKNHVAAVEADGSGKVAWRNNIRVYVPSMLLRDGHLYAVSDNGIAYCWKSDSGKEVWKGRLGGTFSSSPVLAGDLIFATSESGRTFLFKATPAGLKLIAENQLGNQVMATPAISGGRIYLRVTLQEKGRRQEMLFCIGKGE
jgi:outer membrane protein assembly factor BamB